MSADTPIHMDRPRHVMEAGAGYEAMLGGEWLLSDGCGGYAAGTALGVNTRRYHGLLVAASRPPVGRVVCLNQMLEQLVLTAPSQGAANHKGQGHGPHGLCQSIDLTTMLFRDHGQEGGGARLHIPDGYARLTRFEKGLGASWHYQWGQVSVSRALWLHWKPKRGWGAVTLRYRVAGLDAILNQPGAGASLRLGPMVTLRDFHGLVHRDDAGAISADCRGGPAGPVVSVSHDPHMLTMEASQGEGDGDPVVFHEAPDWWYAIEYPVDARRGQDHSEDYFLPGHFEVPLTVGDGKGPDPDEGAVVEASFTATFGGDRVEPIPGGQGRAEHLHPITQRLTGLAEIVAGFDGLSEAPTSSTDAHGQQVSSAAWVLAQASDDFVVDRWMNDKRLSTIIAGYPWFADWGRDTFIALPGLLLCTGRYAEARSVLHAFAQAMGTGPDDGLIPNRFDDYDPTGSAAHYNTVDGSLWFIHAALRYVEASGECELLDDWLGRTCLAIVDAYIRGTGSFEPADSGHTRLIHMADDGLIRAGSPRTQLTWMDAASHLPGRAEPTVFTPRPGKAVEVNALWHHALRGLSRALPERFASRKKQYADLAQRVQKSFVDTFWNEAQGGLFDHVYTHDGTPHADASIRPNQIFAVSLPDSPLNPARQKQVIGIVREHLLTSVGLRTLSEDDPHFHRIYGGPQHERDAAYHQGTIWPWLIGPYAEAVLRASNFSQSARDEARNAVKPLVEFLMQPTPGPDGRTLGGFGQLYEIHQAQPDENHHPPRHPPRKPPRQPPRGCFAQAWSVAEVIRTLDLITPSSSAP